MSLSGRSGSTRGPKISSVSTPAAIVATLHKAIRKAATEPAMIENLKTRGVIPPEEMSPAAFEKMMSDRLASYGEVVRKANIKPE